MFRTEFNARQYSDECTGTRPRHKTGDKGMQKRILLYISSVIASVLLFMSAIFVFGSTRFIAPVVITISLYLFVGSMIKLCRMNSLLRSTMICAIDLLFWIP